MIKTKLILPLLLFAFLLPLGAQENSLKREVTMYNPYKPSLQQAKKRSFLPDMNDTMKIRHDFRYNVETVPFLPAYTISPIKAASLQSDPLPKLYKSFVNIGFGNYISPLAEISITNERSKKGALGFYAKHYSTNGKLKLQNDKKVFAGYMDNDASLFGRKFFRSNLFEASVDFIQKTRYAYGYDTSIVDYIPEKNNIRLNYNNIGAKASFSSLTLDSADFSYDFDIRYDYFYNASDLYQHGAGLSGVMAKSYMGFYVGSGLNYDFARISDKYLTTPKYIASISPFIKKSSDQWEFVLGFKALIDKNMQKSAEFNIYPDVKFGFAVVPSYINFFVGLSGDMERNDPLKIISENPFLAQGGDLFTLPNTDHELIVSAGLKGNTGLEGTYQLSASYSMVKNMLFYSNLVYPDSILTPGIGNYFTALADDVEILNLHGEMNGPINDKLSFITKANLYKYTLTQIDNAWNKPDWDASVGLKYNLRDKIIAGLEITAEGKRKLVVNGDLSQPLPMGPPLTMEMPSHFNMNLYAEYRYSKILSFWTRFDNISYNRYYEWAYYPSQRFLFMVGFTYSL